MKKTISILILTSFYLISFAQNREIEITTKLIIAYTGDSTLLTEQYEIDIAKKKVFYINPVMNYLDIKGEKQRTKICLKKKEWNEIEKLVFLIDFERLEQYSLTDTQDCEYFIEVIMKNEEHIILRLSEENATNELKKIFKIIRN